MFLDIYFFSRNEWAGGDIFGAQLKEIQPPLLTEERSREMSCSESDTWVGL